MKLPLPFLEKKQNLEYFLVLVLRHNKASAVIFEETEGTAKVLSSNEEAFQTSIEDAPDEELLSTLDKTISKAESVLPQNVETQKTIFGLQEGWIDENSKVKKEYLGKLKKISDELGLVPVGFLVTTEAISHQLAKEEGAPVSAILAEIDKDLISVSLVRAGKIVEVKNAPVNGSPADDVDSLLKHFENAEVLPSRIIIFDGERDLSQAFIGHTWSKTLPFLHLPQITNLEQGFDAKAVLSGAATEMGFQVLGETAPSRRTLNPEEKPKVSSNEELQTIDIGQKTSIEQEPAQEEPAEAIEETSKETAQVSEISEEASSDLFGFVKGADVATTKKVNPTKMESNFEMVPEDLLSEEIEEIPENQVEESEKRELPVNAALALASGRKILSKILASFAQVLTRIPALKKLPIKGNKLVFFPIVLVLLFIFLFVYYLTGRSAIVTLDISAKKVTSQKDVTFSTTAKTDPGQNVIAGQFADVSESGSVSENATGSKDIGTPSKGTVTIFNNSSSPISLSSGTKIISSNSLTFTLDKGINVASASGDIFSGTTPGKTDVSVTASDIGTNYNLPSQTHFSLSVNDSVAAKNDNPFSGGTKKAITTFSQDDADKLTADLEKNLESKAKDDIVNKIPEGNVLLPVFVSETLDNNKSFSKNVGDEAGNVTLKSNVIYKAISYSKSDMAFFAKSIFQVPNDQKLDEENILADATNLKAGKDQVSTSLNISAFLIPIMDQSDLAKKISGKSVIDAQKILTSLPQATNATIKISPNIPLFPKNLPDASKIKFSINSNE